MVRDPGTAKQTRADRRREGKWVGNKVGWKIRDLLTVSIVIDHRDPFPSLGDEEVCGPSAVAVEHYLISVYLIIASFASFCWKQVSNFARTSPITELLLGTHRGRTNCTPARPEEGSFSNFSHSG